MKKIYLGEIIMWIILILAVIALIGIITLAVIEWTTQEEVETYTIGMEIIEKDYSRCLELSQAFSKALVLHGDATRQGLSFLQ